MPRKIRYLRWLTIPSALLIGTAIVVYADDAMLPSSKRAAIFGHRSAPSTTQAVASTQAAK